MHLAKFFHKRSMNEILEPNGLLKNYAIKILKKDEEDQKINQISYIGYDDLIKDHSKERYFFSIRKLLSKVNLQFILPKYPKYITTEARKKMLKEYIKSGKTRLFVNKEIKFNKHERIQAY